MSAHDFEVLQEDDRVANGPISAILTIGIIVTITATWIAGFLYGRMAGSIHKNETKLPEPTEAPRTIDEIHQTPIGRDAHGFELRAAQRAALDRWEWIDKDKGVARIPIDRAIQIVIAHGAGSIVPPPNPKEAQPNAPGGATP